MKAQQDTKLLLLDSRVDKQELKNVKYVYSDDLQNKLKSDNYILEEGTIYVLGSDVKIGDGKNTYSNSTTLGGGDLPEIDFSDITGVATISQLPTGTTSTTVALGNHTHSNYVVTTRTVNGKALSANVTLTGADVVITGYTIGTAGALAATDTTNQALGKLEARIVALETAP